MTIRDSTLLPPYKNPFDPQQLEMEEHIARLLKNNATPDSDIQRVLARLVVKTVLGEFRPDMFEGYKDPEKCSSCGGTGEVPIYDESEDMVRCTLCKGIGVEP